MSYLLIEDYNEALFSFEQIEDLNHQLAPWKNLHYYNSLGNIYRKLEEYNKAQRIYKEGSLIFPESSVILHNQAICALLQNDTSSANHYISKLKSALTMSSYPETLIISQVGRVYERAGQIERAEEIWKRTIDMRLNQNPEQVTHFSGNEQYWYYEVLGNLYVDNDMDNGRGVEYLQKALALSKESNISADHPEILSGLGSGYYKQGKYDEALQALKQAENNLATYDNSLHQLIQEVE